MVAPVRDLVSPGLVVFFLQAPCLSFSFWNCYHFLHRLRWTPKEFRDTLDSPQTQTLGSDTYSDSGSPQGTEQDTPPCLYFGSDSYRHREELGKVKEVGAEVGVVLMLPNGCHGGRWENPELQRI